MSFLEDNQAFESWLRKQCKVVEKDLDKKHKRMSRNAFAFLRATYFRWAKMAGEILPKLAAAPQVLAVGDAHLENFGTWRDGEGRLVWGINDFDDAATMPYPFDLVRLCTSAMLSGYIANPDEAAGSILKGYTEGLNAPRPTIVDEYALWMRPFVIPSALERDELKKEIEIDPKCHPPAEVQAGFRLSVPKGAKIRGFATRSKGGGSLGRPRYVAIARWQGGQVVREAKALVDPGWHWAHGVKGETKFLELAQAAYRSWDPHLDIQERFIFRRIAADSRKLDFKHDLPEDLQQKVLEVMGRELGSIHAASHHGKEVANHLKTLPADWLVDASYKAKDQVKTDFAAWKNDDPDLKPHQIE
jgi:Uncharacterized protein conserved in bacteria (DUF2252)